MIKFYKRLREKIHSFFLHNRLAPIVEIVLILFFLVGMLFIVVLIGMRFGIFNVRGSIDDRNAFFINAANSLNGKNVSATTTDSVPLVGQQDNRENVVAEISQGLDKSMVGVRSSVFPQVNFSWIGSDEWQTISAALIKDRSTINRAAYAAGISPRLLVSTVIAEQFRFFTSDRESFKKFFEPLKILGTLSQFSLGVSGMKPDTAVMVEQNLKDPNSEFYPGPQYSHLLDYGQSELGTASIAASALYLPPATQQFSQPASQQATQTAAIASGVAAQQSGQVMQQMRPTSTASLMDGSAQSRALYDRLTDSQDHYYSYLYTALFIKEVEAQWQKAGYDISDRPEIIATIFNLGLGKSVPKQNPVVAGTDITIGGVTYSFGMLSFEFYYSGELADIFGY